ncbi:MAG: hypothetical protein COA83_06830 [Methylophaga sp.]|nr:MAG: hypothetical protein COA83_06830 [Methylophaga sp.]
MQANAISERLLLTLWVGSLLAIGYIAVPMAFATLGDATLAGHFTGKLFLAVNILGLGCGMVLLISKFIAQGKHAVSLWRFWVVLVMLLLSLVMLTYLQPEIIRMAEIKQLTPLDNATLNRFDLFHMISSNVYMVVSLLGVALVVSTDKAP